MNKSMLIRIVFASAVVLLAISIYLATRDSAYAITNANPTGTNIIAFGDSLTFGTGADRDASYPAHLSEILGQTVINKGAPGDTTGSALNRLERDVLAHDPRIVIVGLGGNDAAHRSDRAVVFDNLEKIVQRIQAKGALVIVLSFNFPLHSDYQDKYEALARRNGCPIAHDMLDGIWGNPEVMSDPIHPNGAGYKLMAQKIAPVLQPYVH